MKNILLVLFFGLFFSNNIFAATPTQEIIAQTNNLDLQIYDQLKDKVAKNTEPLIIVWSTKLSFYHNHKLQEYPIVGDEYIDLKTIGHVCLATFALFDSLNEFPKNIEFVKTYQKQLEKTLIIVDKLPLNDIQKARQKIILQKTIDFLQMAINQKSMSQTELKNFAVNIFPYILQNMEDTTKSILVLLNTQMQKIQLQLSPLEKNKLFVVLPGNKMPRQDNILEQYFSKYLNERIDSKRFIYAEGLTDTTNVLNLVGTWQIDSDLAQLFFSDPDSMKRDVLAPSAYRYLKNCHIDPSGKQALICTS